MGKICNNGWCTQPLPKLDNALHSGVSIAEPCRTSWLKDPHRRGVPASLRLLVFHSQARAGCTIRAVEVLKRMDRLLSHANCSSWLCSDLDQLTGRPPAYARLHEQNNWGADHHASCAPAEGGTSGPGTGRRLDYYWRLRSTPARELLARIKETVPAWEDFLLRPARPADSADRVVTPATTSCSLARPAGALKRGRPGCTCLTTGGVRR